MKAAWIAIVLAAAPMPAVQPVYKTGVQLVTVPITVTNAARDQLITAGLQPGDFRLLEDGVPHEITLLTQERRPVSICFVVDASGSMASSQRIENGVRALQQTIGNLTEGDEIAVVKFADQVTTIQKWTGRLDPSLYSWQLAPGAGSMANSSITDAVKAALDETAHAANTRRVIVVISDGFENTSATPLSRIARTQQQSEVLIYAFGMFGRDERAPNGSPLKNILPALVGDAGGVYWNIASPLHADFAAMSLINELKYQMTLGYTPVKPFDGTYRRITVETTVKGLAVRHRRGYLALSPGDQK